MVTHIVQMMMSVLRATESEALAHTCCSLLKGGRVGGAKTQELQDVWLFVRCYYLAPY